MNHTIKIIIDEIFNQVATTTALRMGAIYNKDGSSMAFEHAMTEGDKELFLPEIKDPASMCYEAMNAYFRKYGELAEEGTADASEWKASYQFNVEDTTERATSKVIIYEIQTGDNFDDNLVTTISGYIVEAIKSHALAKWYEKKGLSSDVLLQLDNRDKAISKLKPRLDRRVKSIQRPYRMF